MPEDEIFLLGACFNDRAILQEVIDRLPSKAFKFAQHAEIFNVLRVMYRQDIKTDPDTFMKFCKDNDLLKGFEIHKIVINLTLTGAGIDVDYYIKRLQKSLLKSELENAAKEILHSLEKEDDLTLLRKNIIEKLEDMQAGNVKEFSSNAKIFHNFRDDMTYIEYLDDYLEKRAQGIDDFDGYRTGYKGIDSLVGGFKKGTSTIIGARSSSGKTTFICNLIINLMKLYPDNPLGFFTLEMPKSSIFEKILYTFAEVNYSKVANEGIITQEEYQKICFYSQKIRDWPLYHYDYPGLKTDQFKATIKRAIARDQIKIFFIDYLTKIQSSQKYPNKHLEIDQVSKAIQEVAIEFNIPMVTLAQLNRQAVHRTDKRPVMADLRESGSIEEDADTILMLHRPKHYDTTLQNDHTELFVAKNRHFGELGKITLEFKNGLLIEQPSLEEMMQGAMIAPIEDKHAAWEKSYVRG